MPSCLISRRMTRLAAWLSCAALLSGAFVTPAAAQTDAGALRVLVTDQSGAVVPGATVEVVNVATNVARSFVSDSTGYAQFVPITRGAYSVRVSLAGFQSVDVTGVRVDVGERRFLPVRLEVAAASETVEVVSQSEQNSIGMVVIRGNSIVMIEALEKLWD